MVMVRSFIVLILALMVTGSVVAQEGAKDVGLELVAEGLAAPVDLEDDGSGQLLVVDQVGVIYTITADGTMMEEPFLDIRDRMVELDQGYDERGLLGLELHPDYASNGRFFVYYSAPLTEDGPEGWNHTSRISEFAASGDDMSQADPESERVLLEIHQPQMNHNGGDIMFGPDGYFYIPLGDGGGANDVGEGHTEGTGNAQDTSNLLGSILRIDVNNGDPYGIPEDNPFVGDDNVPDEIWAWGFRNPWRMAFDAETGDLFVGDAGQNQWEEVAIVGAGENHGWNIYEGSHCFDPQNPDFNPLSCETEDADGNPLVMPVIEYGHEVGLVVVGGFVYRGETLPAQDFAGSYFFADWGTSFNSPTGQIFVADRPPEGNHAMWNMQKSYITTTEDNELGEFVLAFGQDAENELYVLTSTTPGPTGDTGKVWKIVPPGGTS